MFNQTYTKQVINEVPLISYKPAQRKVGNSSDEILDLLNKVEHEATNMNKRTLKSLSWHTTNLKLPSPGILLETTFPK